MRPTLVFLSFSTLLFPVLAEITLFQNYSGSTFFDRWTFFSGADLKTPGNVLYISEQQNNDLKLAFLNEAGNAIIKVDNTTDGSADPNYGRASIKISSNDSIPLGSLIIMDAVHLPFGCSVWPAFWTSGQVWPDQGEIDMVENVNLQTANQYSLHTLQGCQHPQSLADPIETGQFISSDCFNQTNGNEGCVVRDPSNNSFGSAFAKNGGGVFATLWTSIGIKIWFFQRGSIPADIGTSSPNPSAWGTPSANYPASSCPMSQFFGSQTLIFNIQLCGQFAGGTYGPPCQGQCTDLIQHPENYNDAYFEVKYVNVFTGVEDNTKITPSTSSASGASSSTSASGKTSSSSTGAPSQTSGSSSNAAMPIVYPSLELMALSMATLSTVGVLFSGAL
ncbi:hypothetical protein SISNIDRAFT_445408 [Sistotremastrum niveocremeum HHB9708]|uniref:GH16 domain-containing protein n=1 Tax=Sistotremastrum niveocremeum HHB9708 TaxID=1314777 RepID=A0A164PSK1_9AGAM|nr:hypothetical protein SISNIDRAFT_445408 [Sistotremastrum niveocremeum HHB9708]